MVKNDPTSEACQLSALIMHAQSHLEGKSPDYDPFVLVNVGGEWCSVRAGIAPTGEHRYAVAIEYLPPVSNCTVSYGIRETVGGTKSFLREETYDTEEFARSALASIERADGRSYSVVKLTETELPGE